MASDKRVLKALPYGSLFVALFLTGAAIGAYASPSPPPIQLVTTPSFTSLPGVIYRLTSNFANITWASPMQFYQPIQEWDSNNTISFGGILLSSYKVPNSYPSASINISAWNPFASAAGSTVFQATVSSPSGSKLYLNLSGMPSTTPFAFQVDGTDQAGSLNSYGGSAHILWQSWSTHTFTILVAGSTSGGGAPGGTPIGGAHIIVPRFAWVPIGGFFSSTSEDTFQFTSNTVLTNTTPPVSYLWSFGDGTNSTQVSPMHQFNYSFSATYNVTLKVCDSSTCNITMQSMSLYRWHILVIGGIVVLFLAAAVVGFVKSPPKLKLPKMRNVPRRNRR